MFRRRRPRPEPFPLWGPAPSTATHNRPAQAPATSGNDAGAADGTSLTSRKRTKRAFPHPDPLVVNGLTRICPGCGAGRDWLILQVENDVYARCRCTHQWHEPEIDAAWCEAHKGPTQIKTYDHIDDHFEAEGFDGTFKGTYLR